MNDPRPHTKDFSEEQRLILGAAVIRARRAAGHPKRPSFLEELEHVGKTSLVKLESGLPVTANIYEEVATHLPGWTADTPVSILKGAEPPEPRSAPPVRLPHESDMRALAVFELAQLISERADAATYNLSLGRQRSRLGDGVDIYAVAEDAQRLAGDPEALDRAREAVRTALLGMTSGDEASGER